MPNKKDDLTPVVALGTCSIQAAMGDGAEKKLPTVDIEGYNGGKMTVGYWGDIVVDLTGLEARDSTPILLSHSAWSLETVLGQTSKVLNDGQRLRLTGAIMAETETVKQVLTLAKNGFQFQASIGAVPKKYRFIDEKETATANGQTHQGPFYLMEQSTLREISIVPLGADGSTSAKIAASHETPKPKEGIMEAQKQTPQEPTAESIRAAAVAEDSRVMKVREIAKDYPEVSAQAVKEGWSPERTELETVKAERAILQAKIKQHEQQDERPAPPNINRGVKAKVSTDALVAAACMGAGMKAVDKAFPAETCEAAADMKVRSITDLFRCALAAEGKPLNATRHDTREFIAAAFSSASIANVVSATANKFVREGYGAVEQSWREVANVRSVVDFKANTGVRLVMSDLLKALAPTGEIQHGSLSDETRTIQADTKALMLAVSRKDIINDDLGVLNDTPRRLGFAAGRTFNTNFWAALEAAVAANFPSDSSLANYTTGALSLTTLATAERLFLALKDADGNPIGMRATKLLCGTTAYQKAREIYISNALVGGTTKDGAANTYVGMFSPVFSSYLAAAPWYLVADPMGMPLMEAAFLNGNEAPTVETADADFNLLGIQMRCYYDYGVAFAERRAAVYSTGA
jgi:hypothetical protein